MNNNTIVYNNIEKLAKKYDLSLQEVAERAGLATNIIYKWKRYNPSKASLMKVAKVLHTTPAYLWNISDPDKKKLTWQDIDMPYGGEIPDNIKGLYQKIAESYLKDHPDKK